MSRWWREPVEPSGRPRLYIDLDEVVAFGGAEPDGKFRRVGLVFRGGNDQDFDLLTEIADDLLTWLVASADNYVVNPTGGRPAPSFGGTVEDDE